MLRVTSERDENPPGSGDPSIEFHRSSFRQSEEEQAELVGSW